jgi:hypothetical protein
LCVAAWPAAIAEQLGISRRTVEVHRANIGRRLSVLPETDPLDHPAVQKALRRLSRRVAMLATELKQLCAQRKAPAEGWTRPEIGWRFASSRNSSRSSQRRH